MQTGSSGSYFHELFLSILMFLHHAVKLRDISQSLRERKEYKYIIPASVAQPDPVSVRRHPHARASVDGEERKKRAERREIKVQRRRCTDVGVCVALFFS